MTDFPENDVIILRDYVPSDLQDVLGGMREQLAPTPSANCSPQPLRTPGSRRAVEPELTVEVLARLRGDERTASVPVLALTAQAMHGDRERFLAAGFDGYLSKPVDIADLVDTVRSYGRSTPR